MSSLRRDLTLSLAAGIGLTSVFSGWALWIQIRASSGSDFDAALLAKAGALATLLEYREGDEVVFDFADEVMPEFHRPLEPDYFEIWIRDGGLLERSLSLRDCDLARRAGPVDAPLFWDLVLPDGRPGRAVGITTGVDYADEADVDHRHHEVYAQTVVAVSREGLDRRNAAVLRALRITGAALLAAGAAVVGIALRRVAQRIRQLTDQLARVDSESLDARIDAGELVTELRPLAATLNTLLERLHVSFVRERRMTSNIAHELRTPVAELRAAVDVARKWPDDPELASQALSVGAKVSLRMSSTIETLLRLGRLQTEGCRLELSAVDFAQMIREMEETLAPEARRRSCWIEHRGATRAIVNADAPLARVLVRNLLENAATHSPEGSRIVSEVSSTDSALCWRLANPAGALTRDDVRVLGEPFWRKEESRAGARHPGLGLALCRTISAALGWKLKFELQAGTLQVFVRLS